ncbi:MAG: type II secretion system major pseudopilin GspG [Pseudomonadota bacterium]
MSTRTKHTKPRRRRIAPTASGFTLIELLVVIALLGLIASIAGPQLFKYLGGAKSDTAQVQIESLGTGIDLYKLEVGRYPPDLEALVEAPSGIDRWNGPYLKKKSVPKDPWGNEYVYRMPGDNGPYDLLSLGADNAEGGEGEDRDVVSWE